MNAAELQPHELMQIVADFFESQAIHYGVVGSMASMAYGEPRFTNDVDTGIWAPKLGVAAEWTLVQQRVNELE